MAKRKRSSQKSKGKKSGGCISQIGGGIILVIFLAVIAMFGRSSKSNSTRVASAPTSSLPTMAHSTISPATADIMRTAMREARQTEFAKTADMRFTERALTQTSSPATPRPTENETQTLYTTGNANLRPCTKTTSACAPAGAVSGGQELTVLEQVEGDVVSGSNIWYKVLHNGQELYIHSSLVSATRPTVQPTGSQQQSNTSGGAGNQSSSPVNTPIVASTIEQPPVVGASCPSLDYTCPQLTCEQAYACLAAGNGRLDADKDGKPCETQCGG